MQMSVAGDIFYLFLFLQKNLHNPPLPLQSGELVQGLIKVELNQHNFIHFQGEEVKKNAVKFR